MFLCIDVVRVTNCFMITITITGAVTVHSVLAPPGKLRVNARVV